MIPYGAKRLAIRNGKPRASGDDPAVPGKKYVVQT